MEEAGTDFILAEKDIVIIGGGPAGYVAVIHATHLAAELCRLCFCR